jgi:hypothetical protein
MNDEINTFATNYERVSGRAGAIYFAREETFPMISGETQTLLELARWTSTHRNSRSAIRQLAGTEENYLLFIRELDRIESQGFRARARHAEVTLTLVEWIEALDHFDWRCAYCQQKPFQVMSHYLPLLQGGMTALNCLPSCYHCRHGRKEINKHIQDYFMQVQAGKEYVLS